MARSLHTQKLELRAARRLARPYSKRRTEAALLSGRTGDRRSLPAPRPPIIAPKPPVGTDHFLKPRDIRSFVGHLDPTALYGVKSIRLRSEPAIRNEGIVFGEYAPKGEIHLYALPRGEWRLPFVPALKDRAAFRRFGATVECDFEKGAARVVWPVDGLKRYLLYEVLAHELGHHALQRRRGKFVRPVCRRREHEAYAELCARRALSRIEASKTCE